MKPMIPWAKPSYWGREREYIIDAVDSLWISGGLYIEKLEKKFAEYFNNKFVITTSNGTTSIHLIYQALGLQPGDEVIVPGFAFLAASNLAVQFHINPVFAEVCKDTWCLNPDDFEGKITAKTKAVIPIHTYGNVCEMNQILEIANKKNIFVIEDCAESLFSRYNNQYCGTFGFVNSFSFQATKTITTGEGGMVVTSDDSLCKKMKLIRSHGLIERGKYWHEIPGHNFRLTNFQAAMGLAQLECIEKIKTERERVYKTYLKYLRQEEGMAFQKINNQIEPVIWAIAVYLDKNAFLQGRDKVMEQLRELNIETRPGFVASSLLKIYDPHNLTVCEDLSNHIISLPSFPTLTEEEIYYICSSLKKLKR